MHDADITVIARSYQPAKGPVVTSARHELVLERAGRGAARFACGVAGLGARRIRRDALRARAPPLINELSIDEGEAGMLGSLTLVASGIGGVGVRHDRRPARPPPGDDRQHCRVLGVHGRVRTRAERLALAYFVSCSGSGWAASGRAARRSSRRRGPIGTAPRPSRSCRALGRWLRGRGGSLRPP